MARDPLARLVRSPARGRLTLLGAITLDGLVALMTIRAFTDRAVFRAFVSKVLVPVLRPGQVVVLDNLPAHKYPEIATAVEAVGCRLLFLPIYSPEFNPIELCWSKRKGQLRSRASRTLESLQEAVAQLQPTNTPENAHGWFTHYGYRPI